MFATHLKDLVISDEAMLAGGTFTQFSDRWDSTPWLDHFLSRSYAHNLTTAVHDQYDTSCSDHIPLIVDIFIEFVPVLKDTVNDATARVDWDKLSVAGKAAYDNNADTILSSVKVHIEAICFKDVNCENLMTWEFLQRVGGCYVCG